MLEDIYRRGDLRSGDLDDSLMSEIEGASWQALRCLKHACSRRILECAPWHEGGGEGEGGLRAEEPPACG